MKTILVSFLFSTILLIGFADDSSDLNSSDTQITKQSTSPKWVKLPGDKGKDFSVEFRIFCPENL